MNERQVWRPKPAPKPRTLTTTSNDQHAAALRGATLAFSPTRAGHTTSSTDNKSSAGAVSAARAGHGKGDQSNGGSRGRVAVSPARGRSHLSHDIQEATDNQQQEPNRADSARPRVLERAASEIAARAASVNASPNRGLTGLRLSQSPVRSSQSGSQETRSREASVVSRGQPSPGIEARDALAGAAAAAMSQSPPSHGTSSFSTGAGKLDLSKIPSLVATPSSPTLTFQPIASSLSAARSASRGAEARTKERSRQTSPMPPPRHAETDPIAFKASAEPRKTSLPDPPAPRKDSLTVPAHGSPVQRAKTPDTPRPNHKARSNTQDSMSQRPATHDSNARSSPATKPITIPSRAKQSTDSHFSPMSASPSSRTPQSAKPSGMTANSLADAMVSASLASRYVPDSRGSTPPKRKHGPPAPPPSRPRRSSSAHAVPSYRHAPAPPPRMKPLPTKPMRSTLRKHSPDTNTKEEKRGRKHHLRKHPNMHHEGDRKRWRDKLTERERKRYEGVWAANKGLLLDYEDAPTNFPLRLTSREVSREDTVVNVVVRDIWDRSRLPRDVLEEVWDLVAEGEEMHCLNRSQFVVGLWLIDLRLKGRKLPVKVSDSVWASVRHTTGVKVRSKVMV